MTMTDATQRFYGTGRRQRARELRYRYFVPAIGVRSPNSSSPWRSRPEERVLARRCGSGVVARLAADRVGPAGSVAGADVNAGMPRRRARWPCPPAARRLNGTRSPLRRCRCLTLRSTCLRELASSSRGQGRCTERRAARWHPADAHTPVVPARDRLASVFCRGLRVNAAPQLARLSGRSSR